MSYVWFTKAIFFFLMWQKWASIQIWLQNILNMDYAVITHQNWAVKPLSRVLHLQYKSISFLGLFYCPPGEYKGNLFIDFLTCFTCFFFYLFYLFLLPVFFYQLFYLFFEICIALFCFRVDGNVLKLDLFCFFFFLLCT